MSEDEISDSQYANPGTPPDLQKTYNESKRNLLPTKSGDLYTKAYDNFVKWQKDRKTNSTSVRVLLTYFSEMSETRAPSTLWSEYSKLKSTIKIHQGVDIGTYSELIAFLKKKSKGYETKKAPALTGLHVEDFLVNADDSRYLFEKVALTLGILGACRREELTNMRTVDLEIFYSDKDREKKIPMMLIQIPFSKNGKARSFVVKDGFYQIVQRYIKLRPSNVPHQRFFINYQNGKCTKQAIGINKMGKVPFIIAQFLGLPNPERYTSHTIRHTGASLFIEGGGNMEDLKRLGGWKSDTAASGYITHSKSSKEKICEKITSAIILPSTSFESKPSGSSPRTLLTKASNGSNSELTSSRSSPVAPPMEAIAGSSSRNISLGKQIVSSVSDKENVVPIELQTARPGITLSINDCTNCTFHIEEKKNA
ncbi:uncharacterized protein [Venturia canescens]|uniref:uncharacterized protein n=1 Tax=Venturia canescens TaxID=32260 RepID=UPI001C9C8544|nr:uncharacterized protein LOC122406379 [Venturia canescens]XP_043267723.1 uncharacterized protein LOC122406379 [Venturia canescens]XP_043267724.1 uncharacterized protein LOC122406379 [Venturia canescens]XP_043267725.1 uncharacterized protein LOC122406379 [Venturia canescens]XP_043267726.1 uncharacterized protein LOC122406379 [Venturia canescens]